MIKTAASTIQYVRAGDCVARFGGEEFVVLLQTIESREAMNRAERLRAGFEQRAVGSDASGVPVTISVDLALSTADDRDPDDVIEKADQALTMRNRAEGTAFGSLGRNRRFWLSICRRLQSTFT